MTSERRRILVVEDDGGARAYLLDLLEEAGYDVTGVVDGGSALRELDRFNPDCALVDLGLPGNMDGFDVARVMRQRSDLGLIVITGSAELADEKRALDVGADDYIEKPFKERILLARLAALLRRLSDLGSNTHQVGALTIDEARHHVTFHGSTIAATPTEYGILRLLARRPGRPVTKDALLHEVWGSSSASAVDDGAMVEVHVSRLRRKLSEAGPQPISTIRNVGYVLDPSE